MIPGLEVLEDRLTPSGQPTSLIGQPSSATVALSNQALILADSAVLSGGSGPTGTVAFTLYNPNGVLVDTETASVSGNGTYDTSTGYALPTTGSVVGTYQWDVAYSGDANNAPSSDNNDSGEQVVVSAAGPVLSGTPSSNLPFSMSSTITLQDSASLYGGYNEGGTLTFTLLNPGGTAVDTETVSVNGDGTYSTTTGFTLPSDGSSVIGTYQWNVSYSGDANNAPSSDNSDPAEQVVVSAAGPVLSGTPSSNLPFSMSSTITLQDSASLYGGYNEGGTLTFTLLNPGGTVVDTETVSVNGDGTYSTTTGFTLPSDGSSVIGTYQWNVSYSGDANNAAVSDLNDPAEQTVVSAATPWLSDSPSPTYVSFSMSPGTTTLQDSVSLANGYDETGTITFTLLNPGGTAVDTETVSVNGDGTYSTTTGFTLPSDGSSVIGTYQWNVSYSGDANNAPVSDMNDPAEQVVVSGSDVPTVTLSNPGNQTYSAGNWVSLNFSGSDSDMDALSYTATGLPSWLTIDASSGSISGTVPSDAATNGMPYSITVTATDTPANVSASQTIALSVNGPTVYLSNPGDQTYSAGNWVSLDFYGSDSDMDTLTYTASGLPSWLSIDSSGTISGTIPSDAATNGTPYSITVTATDTAANVSASQTITLTVNAPTVYLYSPGNQTYSAGNWVSLDFYGSDSDMDTLSYTATGLPSWLTIDSGSGSISGTVPGYAATNGTPYSITVTATDTGADVSANQTITLSVNAPTVYLSNPGNQTYSVGNWVSLDFYGSDSDMDTLTYTATGLPSWLTIDSGSGMISGTIPSNAATGVPYVITVTATDSGADVSTSQTIDLTVSPPTVYLSNPGNQTYSAGNMVSLDFYGSDSDMDALTYTATGLPSWLTIDSGSGTISGTVPGNAATGDNLDVITVTATDAAANVSTSQTIDVTVTPPTVYLSNPGTITNSEGDLVNLALSATDSAGDALQYTATNLPQGLVLDDTTGVISGTIWNGASLSGPYSVTVTATDSVDSNSSASQTFTWNVNPVVTLANPGAEANADGDPVEVQISATDSAGNAVTYSAAGLPAGLSVNPTTGVISGTVSAGDDSDSPYNVTLTAADSVDSSASASRSFSWTVLASGAVTVTLGQVPDQTNIEGDTASLSLSASSSDGNPIIYGATNLPAGLSIDPATGIISGTIDDGNGVFGPYPVTVTATDSAMPSFSAEQTFTWTVHPAVSLLAPSQETDADGDTVFVGVTATDSENADVYSASNLPPGLTIDPNYGNISGTIAAGADADSPYTVVLTATDSIDSGASSSQTLLWTVTANGMISVTVAGPLDQTNAEGSWVSLTVGATDSAGNPVTFAAIGLPPGLSMNPTTGFIAGSMSYGDSANAPYSVTLVAIDSTNATIGASAAFQWNVNPLVSLTAPSAATNADGDTVYLPMSALDSAGNALVSSAANLPPGLAIDPNSGIISGTIAAGADSGSPYTVTVTATDTDAPAAAASQTFAWTVNATGTISVSLAQLTDPTNSEQDAVNLTLSATDSGGNALVFGALNLPAGLSINPITGVISGTVSDGASANGPYTVTVFATDSTNPDVGAYQTFQWTVNPLVTISGPSSLTDQTGDTVDVVVSATDSAGSNLLYWANDLPAGLSIDPNTGVISGQIGATAGNAVYTVTVGANDSVDANGLASITISWTVTFDPYAPLNQDGSYSVIHDQTLSNVNFALNDPDAEGNPMSVTIVTGPADGTLTENSDGTWDYTPNAGFFGTDTVTISANGGAPLTVVINVIYDAPVLTSTYLQMEADNGIYQGVDFGADVSNPDGNSLTVQFLSLPQNGSLVWDAAEGQYDYVANPGYLGRDTFSYRYYDGISYSAPVTVDILDYTDSMNWATASFVTGFALPEAAFNGAPTNTGLRQRNLNDCWFVAAEAGLVTSNSRATVFQEGNGARSTPIIQDNGPGPGGASESYTVTFPGRTAVTILFAANERFALGGPNQTVALSTNGNNGDWSAILELAWAKLNSPTTTTTQAVITVLNHGEELSVAINALTGNSTDPDDFWCTNNSTTERKLTAALNAGRIVTAGTAEVQGTKVLNNGLVSDHVYTVLAYNPLTDEVQLRNPWNRNPTKLDNDEALPNGGLGLGGATFWMSLRTFTSDFDNICYEE